MATAREIHGISSNGVEVIQQAIDTYVGTIKKIVDNNSLVLLCKDYAAGPVTNQTINDLDKALRNHINSYLTYIQGFKGVMSKVKTQYQRIDENTESLNAGISAFNTTRKS